MKQKLSKSAVINLPGPHRWQALNACYNNTPTNYSFLLKKVIQENCPVLLSE